MNNKIHPIEGEEFCIRLKVLSVKYKKDTIVLRCEEYFSKSKFNLTYHQQKLIEEVSE